MNADLITIEPKMLGFVILHKPHNISRGELRRSRLGFVQVVNASIESSSGRVPLCFSEVGDQCVIGH